MSQGLPTLSSMSMNGEPWSTLSASARVLAEAGQRLLEDAPGVPGVAFLGTVGLDGIPRIHPFIPAVVEGTLWAFVVTSPKQRDLERSGGFGIHSRLGREDESFYCAGSARRVDDQELRSTVGRVMPYDEIDERHLLYEFLIARALWTTWTTPTSPIHTTWTSRLG